MRRKIGTAILLVGFMIGISLLLYPTVSDYWNSFHQTKAISTYVEDTANLTEERYEQMWDSAVAYNAQLAERPTSFTLSEQQTKDYLEQLNVTATGIMSYIEIPKINCKLPIYHGIDENVLQVAVGHLPGSSLPVGGESTHCVLSAHRGLPSARLFTDIDQLVEGDTFMIDTMGQTLTYEVDQILTVLPYETDALQIEQGKDLCTLVTCTPYGINSHRLLVRGHRVDNQMGDGEVRVTADAIQIEPVVVAPLVAAPILLILLAVVLWPRKKRRK